MAKNRRTVSARVRENVLKEFNHLCAMCGSTTPQVHHIDGNPEHNDINNLIPLCPNCHLIDQHNPTATPDPNRLALFRVHKDPSILNEKFLPIWNRCRFLLEVGRCENISEVRRQSCELVEFISHFQMGGFYSKRLDDIIGIPVDPRISESIPLQLVKDFEKEELRRYKQRILSHRDHAISLIVELLRYQEWQHK